MRGQFDFVTFRVVHPDVEGGGRIDPFISAPGHIGRSRF